MTPATPAPSSRRALLLQAARGLLLAGQVLALALVPWPTAWAMSAALAPYVQIWRLGVIHNLDAITVGLVVLATIEPLLLRLLTLVSCGGQALICGVWHTPRLLWLLARLVWAQSRISYWRFRNWRRAMPA